VPILPLNGLVLVRECTDGCVLIARNSGPHYTTKLFSLQTSFDIYSVSNPVPLNHFLPSIRAHISRRNRVDVQRCGGNWHVATKGVG
jgi:hypothetical protein